MATLITLDTLSQEEQYQLDLLLGKLARFEARNRIKEAYYEGEQRVRQLGISIPPRVLDAIRTVVGWSGTAVDVLEERLDWLGWVESGTDFGLADVFSANDLDVDSGLGHLDALIYGIAFACVGSGADGEPDQLITVESPRDMTGIWNPRTRRLGSAASRFKDPETHAEVEATLYLPDQTIYMSRGSSSVPWEVINRDQHNLGRVPVAPLVNRPRASRVNGRSEISQAVRGYTDAAVRTLLGMEVNREFYSAPQRYAVGVSENMFQKADGGTITGWEAISGRMLVAPYDEDNPEATPSVGQFAQSQPGPYLEQVRGLAQMFAAECAIPPTYLGFASDQAASADAIRAMETRLVKRAERRQLVFGKAWLEVARLIMLMREGSVPKGFETEVAVRWRDAATPTRSAAADEATKLVGAGVLPADSQVTYDRIGLTDVEVAQVEKDKRKATLRDLAAQQTQATTPGQPQNSPTAQPGANTPAPSAA